MMFEWQFGLVLAYLLPTGLVAWLLTSQGFAHKRAAAIVLLMLPVFYIGHYLLLERIQGWPSASTLPDSFRLIAFEAIEPDKRTGDPGSLLIWAQADDSPAPRVHRLAYDSDLHRRLSQATEQDFAGKPQRGEYRSAEESEAGERSGNNDSTGLFFRDETRHRLPPKT